MRVKDLETTGLFQEISKCDIERMLVCSKAYRKKYASGEYIFRQGDRPSKVFLLLQGSVSIAKDFASGKRDVLYRVEEGNVFGDMFLFADMESYWYDAMAVEEVEVLAIPWSFFYHFCENACRHHQLLTRNMLELFSKREFHITKKLHIVSTASLRERICIWLIDSADGQDKVEVKMKREELADFLGVARPSLSRELMRMQEDGLIEVSKKYIYLKDRNSIEMLYA